MAGRVLPRTPGGAAVFVAASALAGVTAFAPRAVLETAGFVLWALVDVAPLVVPGILLAAWVAASGTSARIAGVFDGHTLQAVIAASAIGAVAPVCGVTVLPLLAGLLASGVPLALVMAFWLSSPITDPAMLAATAATLGFEFAIAKTAAAFGLGIFAGLGTTIAGPAWTGAPLRASKLVSSLGERSNCEPAVFDPMFWRLAGGHRRFWSEVAATGRLVLICLIPAFAAEFWLSAALSPQALSASLGQDAWWAVPLAVLVGAPAYLDGFAALPLTRAMLDHGMSPGAALSFLVSGGAISVWGAMAIFPVLKIRPFLLYLALATWGSMAAGWIFEAVM